MNDSLTSGGETSRDSSARTTPESPYLINSFSPGNPLANKALRLLSRPARSSHQDKHKRYSVQELSLHNGGQYTYQDNFREEAGGHHTHRISSNSRRPKSHIVYPYVHSNFSASQPALNSIGEAEIQKTGFYDDHSSTAARLEVKSAQFHSSTVDLAYPKLIKHSLEDLLHMPGPVAVKTPTVPKIKCPKSSGCQDLSVGTSMTYPKQLGWSDPSHDIEHTNPRSIMKPVPVEQPKAARSKRVSFTGSENFQLSSEPTSNSTPIGVNCEGNEATYSEASPSAVNKLPHTCRPMFHELPNGVHRSRKYSYSGPLSTNTTDISISNQLPLQTTAPTIDADCTHSISTLPQEQIQAVCSVSTMQSIESSAIPEGLGGYLGDSQSTSKAHHFQSPPTYVSQPADAIDSQPLISVTRSPPPIVSLCTYASSKKSQFPKRVMISKGALYPSGGRAVSVGQELNLHFLKRTRVVLMQDSRGDNYVLPLHTAIRASIVYNPSSSEKTTSKDPKFKSAGDIMNLKHIPLVIAATKKYNGGSDNSSVEDGEIMIVGGIKTDSYSGRCLKVQSINGAKKLLNENCAAHFTTKPSLTAISIQDMFNSNIQLPQKVILHATPTFQQGAILPSMITFSQYATATSVIATDAFLLANQVPSRVLELSSNLDIELQETVGVSETVEVQLLEMTEHLYQSFDPSMTTHCFDAPRTVIHELQCALYMSLSTINPSFGMELVKPAFIEQAKSSPLHNPLFFPANASDSVAASQSEIKQERQLSTNKANLANDPHSEWSTVSELIGQIRTLEARCTKTDQLLTTFSQQFEEINSVLSKLQNAMLSSTQTINDPVNNPHPLHGSFDTPSRKVGVTDLSVHSGTQPLPTTGSSHDPNGNREIGVTVLETCTHNPPVGSTANPKGQNDNKQIVVSDAQEIECLSGASPRQNCETASVISPKQTDNESRSAKRGYLAKRMNRAIARFDKLRGKQPSQTTITSGSKGKQQPEHKKQEATPTTRQMNKHNIENDIEERTNQGRQSSKYTQAGQSHPHLKLAPTLEVSFKNQNQSSEPNPEIRTIKPAVLPKPAKLARLNVNPTNPPGLKKSPEKTLTINNGSDLATNIRKGGNNQSTGMLRTNRIELELSRKQQQTLATLEPPIKPLITSPPDGSVTPIQPESSRCQGAMLIVDTIPQTATDIEVSISKQNDNTRPNDCITSDASIPFKDFSVEMSEKYTKPNNVISSMHMGNDSTNELSLQEDSEDLDLLVDNITAWCSQMEAEVSQMSLADFQG